MSTYFRFQRVDNFDPIERAWHVTHRTSETYLGEVKLAAARNFQVRRANEANFHGTHATRVQAARWLKNQRSSSAVFDDDVEAADEESDDSN